MNGLIWFRHDLRLSDNPALTALSRRCKKAILLYVIDPNWFRPSRHQCAHMGKFRQEFLYQSLRELDSQLRINRQRLVVKVGNPLEIIPKLCKKHSVDLVAATSHPGVFEQHQIANLKRNIGCEVITAESFTLFLENQIPFQKDDFPATFTQFRKFVEKNHILPCIPISTPEELPQRLVEASDSYDDQEFVYDLRPYQGGEDSAAFQLNQYFWKSHRVKSYKQTRNGFDGWNFSSRLSAWLANGSISARTVAAELDNYEYRHGKDESTQALYFELLWREYFQWMMKTYGAKMFQFTGIKDKRPLTSFYSDRYKSWEEGTTEYPLVNACMRQLKQTGWLSNRGRQIVASCLVNELGVDWRFGAAYFEQQLIDFDVASNYGNWQYLAGVGADPRGQRHFNLEKQAEMYDPDGTFTRRWSKNTSTVGE
ncbi:deoxyribodipyrimidine photolyase [Veronia nyctiphanis]|uniref:Cryptochrome DASH n=1 Tax=Veronia nyctiphanis TaxID=1278244 RepID=A0A4Q0YY21_9GAMM|nr:DASH family cryptochrome [Veronia nyctiphanis]RXJ74109.1 deoxyribodipyrimidine photolyase [Veronia nyctiphanis]